VVLDDFGSIELIVIFAQAFPLSISYTFTFSRVLYSLKAKISLGSVSAFPSRPTKLISHNILIPFISAGTLM
jgi:hypothetical protein